MRDQHRVEPSGLGVLTGHEFVRGEGGEPAAARFLHGRLVVVDADAAAVEVLQVATDTAADVEDVTEAEAAEVPPVRRLDVEQALPPDGLELLQSLGVRVVAGVAHSGKA